MNRKDNLDTAFRPNELVLMKHYDKRTGEYRTTEYPKVGGRLRIAHAVNDTLDITTEIIQYDGNVAVVKAVCSNDKGAYSGFGMASVERDNKLADAILELAETRAIARSLRFSGVGVEFCGAEEVSHLQNGKPSSPPVKQTTTNHQQIPDEQPPLPENEPHIDGNGSERNNNRGRLSQKQHSFILRLAGERGLTQQALDDLTRERFGSVLSFISKTDASNMIKEMTTN